MATIILQKFDGGICEDPRTTATDQNERNLNFNIFSNPHKLIPYPDSVVETVDSGSASKHYLGGVDVASTLITVGYVDKTTGVIANGDLAAQYMGKTNLIDTWTKTGYGKGGNYETFSPGSLIIYKGKPYNLIFYTDTGATQYSYKLQKLDPIPTLTGVAYTANMTSAGKPLVKPVIHNDDNILYFAAGNSIARWNDSSFTYATDTLNTAIPTTKDIKAMTPYGSYLAIGCSPTTGLYGESNIYLWGRDMTLNTFQGNIPCGEGTIKHLAVLNNNLIIIMTSQSYLNATNKNKLLVKIYNGATVETLKSLDLLATTQTFFYDHTISGDKLYFASSGVESSIGAIYCVGKNKEGQYIVTQDRWIDNSNIPSTQINGLSIIGDTLFAGYGTPSVFTRSMVATDTPTYNANSIFKTTINPNMPLTDKGKNKQLTAVRIYYTGGSGIGTIGVQYSVDGSTLAYIINEATTAVIENMKQTTMQADGNALLAGYEFQFQLLSTGGCSIKSVEYSYDILNQ